jgi:hypothetical protein
VAECLDNTSTWQESCRCLCAFFGRGVIVIILNRMLRTEQDWYNLITGAYKCTETERKPYDYIHTCGGLIDGSTRRVRCVFWKYNLTRFKSEVRELHRIITLNPTESGEKIKTNLDWWILRILRTDVCLLLTGIRSEDLETLLRVLRTGY